MTNTQLQYLWFFLMLAAAGAALFLFFKTSEWPTVPCVIGGVVFSALAIYSLYRLSKKSYS